MSGSGQGIRGDAGDGGLERKPESSSCGEWEVLDAPTQAGTEESVILGQPLAGGRRESEAEAESGESGEPLESTELEEDDGEEEAEGWDDARREA
jgi:hypothetical protein